MNFGQSVKSRREIDSFTLLKEYLELVEGNIEELEEIHDEIVQYLNEILSLLE